MTVTVEDLVRQVAAIEMAAQALLLNARVLHAQIQTVVQASGETSSSTEGASAECTCPPKYRKMAAIMGHPGRTVCANCGKEHD